MQAFWAMLPMRPLALKGDQAFEGVCEKHAMAYLMATWTRCVPRSVAVCMALRREAASTSDMLEWTRQASSI